MSGLKKRQRNRLLKLKMCLKASCSIKISLHQAWQSYKIKKKAKGSITGIWAKA